MSSSLARNACRECARERGVCVWGGGGAWPCQSLRLARPQLAHAAHRVHAQVRAWSNRVRLCKGKGTRLQRSMCAAAAGTRALDAADGRRPAHLVLLLRRQRLHVALAGPQLEAKQRRQHSLLLLLLLSRLPRGRLARLQMNRTGTRP